MGTVLPGSSQGLRLNRTLLCLSLSNNRIGDAGATNLAQVFSYLPVNYFVDQLINCLFGLLRLFHQTLGEFALTHEEAEERTKLMGRKPVSEADHTFKLFDLWVAGVHPVLPPTGPSLMN